MPEKTISREEADVLHNAIHRLVDDLERSGHDRGTIGSAMTGVGLAMVQVHIGHDVAMRMIGSLESILVKDNGGMQ
jgi:hypothetical protein